MDSSTGKKIMKTDIKMVPNLKSEKKVNVATTKANYDIISISIKLFELF